MQRSSYGVSRSRGAVKAGSTFGSSTSPYSTSRSMPQQANSSTGRALPKGPGPLPNRYVLDKSSTHSVKYMAAPSSSTRDRTNSSTTSTTLRHFNYQKSNVVDSPTTTRRKSSDDSGYGSSGGKDRTTSTYYRYGDLRNGKSKSLSHLSHQKDEPVEMRTPYRARTDSSSHEVSAKTYSQNHLGSKTTLNGSCRSNSTSIYRSTTHSDYKYPSKEDRNLSSKTEHNSYSSDKELSNGHTAPGKNNYSVIDVDKTRKATITALPGEDLKFSRKSSLSSSNSSPSCSVSIQTFK